MDLRQPRTYKRLTEGGEAKEVKTKIFPLPRNPFLAFLVVGFVHHPDEEQEIVFGIDLVIGDGEFGGSSLTSSGLELEGFVNDQTSEPTWKPVRFTSHGQISSPFQSSHLETFGKEIYSQNFCGFLPKF